ncbi:hypothetical protein PoB_000961200 [Plakobranchus ocellatus]|uniref:Uncharacterized protein n=1 Tax=Plakobranchus ocellatus TaxID=259542 RepID=A0AAV3YLU2_9GAST|nr:hypothetical protein PoB_000961200 [Plakobranchus ocellatus]
MTAEYRLNSFVLDRVCIVRFCSFHHCGHNQTLCLCVSWKNHFLDKKKMWQLLALLPCLLLVEDVCGDCRNLTECMSFAEDAVLTKITDVQHFKKTVC